MKDWLLALPFAMLLPSVFVPDMTKTIYVFKDNGGDISDRISEIQEIRMEGSKIRIEGVCKSSCAMYLGYEKTCVTPNSEFWFHSARAKKNGKVIHNPEKVARLNQLIADQYPDFLAEEFLAEWQFHHGKDFVKRSGAWMIERGIAECE